MSWIKVVYVLHYADDTVILSDRFSKYSRLHFKWVYILYVSLVNFL